MDFFDYLVVMEGYAEVPQRILNLFAEIGFKENCVQHKDFELSGEKLLFWKEVVKKEIEGKLLIRTPLEKDIRFKYETILGLNILMDLRSDIDVWLITLQGYYEMAVSAIEQNKSIQMIFIDSIDEAPEDFKKIHNNWLKNL